MKILLATILFFSMAATSLADALTLRQVSEAACRITVTLDNGKAYGTGTVVKKANNEYFVLTNAHVAKTLNSTVVLDFYRLGKVSDTVQGRVVWLYYSESSSIDLAIISVPASSFKVEPRIIPVAPREFKIANGQYIYGSGFPQGDWLHSWEASVIKNTGFVVSFNMPPIGGQSGTGIMANIPDGKGDVNTMLVGVLAWRVSDGIKYGAGIALERIYQVLNRTAERDYIPLVPVVHNEDEICGTVHKDGTVCGRPKSDHYYLIMEDGSFYERNGKPYLFCPGTHTDAQCPNGRCFPFRPPTPTPNNPYIPPILGPDLGPGPEEPSPIIGNLQEKIKELEDRIADLLAREGGYEGEIENLTNELEQLRKVNDDSVKQVEALEEEKKGLLARLADRVKGFNIPFLPDFGTLGNVISLVIAAVSSGSVGALIWHNFALPFIIRRFGWLPGKIIGGIVRRRLNIKSKEQLEEDLGLSQKKK